MQVSSPKSDTGSREVARVALRISLTEGREEERTFKASLLGGIRAAAVDYGGEYTTSVARILERAVVAAKREGVIEDNAREEGAVVGATHEALTQIAQKAIGLNVGGKIGIARSGSHVAVSVYFGIGLLHLNDVAIGLGHRVV